MGEDRSRFMSIVSTLTKKIAPKRSLYVQLMFTALTFLAMSVLSYAFMRSIIHRNVVSNAERTFSFAQTQIETTLMEPRTMLGGFSDSIRDMIADGADADAVRLYIHDISEFIRTSMTRIVSTNSMFGYFETLSDAPVIGLV